MATDSFKFWDSYMRALDRVDDATAGRLVKALCHEVFDGERQDFDGEPLLGMVYDVMLGQARQSMELSRIARESGARGGRPRKNGTKRVPKGSEKGTESEKKREEVKGTETSSLSNSESPAAANPTQQARPAGPQAPPPLT